LILVKINGGKIGGHQKKLLKITGCITKFFHGFYFVEIEHAFFIGYLHLYKSWPNFVRLKHPRKFCPKIKHAIPFYIICPNFRAKFSWIF
jgi:hypothetical protein